MIGLILAAVLMFVTGIAHSYLGERYILIRLFKRDGLPKIFGSTAFTTGTLRFVWHLTTVAWWGLAWLILYEVSLLLTHHAICHPGLEPGSMSPPLVVPGHDDQPPHSDGATRCGFGVKSHAMAKNGTSCRLAIFCVVSKVATARLSPQSPVA